MLSDNFVTVKKILVIHRFIDKTKMIGYKYERKLFELKSDMSYLIILLSKVEYLGLKDKRFNKLENFFFLVI
jgi:hypothetical protein